MAAEYRHWYHLLAGLVMYHDRPVDAGPPPPVRERIRNFGEKYFDPDINWNLTVLAKRGFTGDEKSVPTETYEHVKDFRSFF